jgi:hypothetical protein
MDLNLFESIRIIRMGFNPVTILVVIVSGARMAMACTAQDYSGGPCISPCPPLSEQARRSHCPPSAATPESPPQARHMAPLPYWLTHCSPPPPAPQERNRPLPGQNFSLCPLFPREEHAQGTLLHPPCPCSELAVRSPSSAART